LVSFEYAKNKNRRQDPENLRFMQNQET
jgi:hypothetical protein